MTWDLRIGDWRETLASVPSVGLLCTDPPYGARTHKGHDAGMSMVNRVGRHWIRSQGVHAGTGDPIRPRRELSYKHFTPDDVHEFCAAWAPRCTGWAVIMSCSDLSAHWREGMEQLGRCAFAPVPVVIPGMTVRMSGDGPSSWAIYLNISRPRGKEFAGGWTRPGAYVITRGTAERRDGHIGGKPLELMLRIVREYTRPGDLVVDPCAGYSTTGIAAEALGFPFVGAEVDIKSALAGLARRDEIKRDSSLVDRALQSSRRSLTDAFYGDPA